MVKILADQPYAHRLIFLDEEAASRAEQIVKEHIKPFDCYIDIDTDERTTYEVRFLTERGLKDEEITDIVRLTDPNSYEMNTDV